MRNPLGQEPLIYLARGVDDLDGIRSTALANVARAALAGHGLRLIDPLEFETALGAATLTADLRAAALVELDLALLRRADAVLMDMTIPNRNYVGCVAELVYARL